MNKAEFQHARRVVRTFHTFCEMALHVASETNDADMLYACNRWMQANYDPLKSQIDMAQLWVDHCRGYGPSIQALRGDAEMKARFLTHFRMARYYRKPCRLPN